MSKHSASPTISEAGFSIIWTTSYPSLLAEACGTLISRGSYTTRPSDWVFPWDTGGPRSVGPKGAKIKSDRFDSFWGAYLLNNPDSYWNLTNDLAWDLAVPVRRKDDRFEVAIDRQSVVEADLEAYLYPSAICVLFRAKLQGSWALEALVDQITALRASNKWEVRGPAISSTKRSLDGIAEDIDGMVAPALSSVPNRKQGGPSVLTAAALIGVDGALNDKAEDIRRGIAGLASLDAPCAPEKDGFLEPNRKPSNSAHMYVDASGHAMWPPGRTSGDNNLWYLLRSQTELAAHISALGGVIEWAAGQIESKVPVPVAVQPLIHRHARMLSVLLEGDPRITYRAGLAKMRIQALSKVINLVQDAL